MSSTDHFAFGIETAFGTWIDPTYALGVRSASIRPTQNMMNPEETGTGRGANPAELGELMVGGAINTRLHPVNLPILLASMFGNRTSATSDDGYLNKLLPDDDIEQPSFSLQERYDPNFALSFRGAKVSQFEIAAAIKQYAMATATFVGKDVADSPNGTWVSDDSAAPAVVDPWPYITMPPTFKFYNGVIRLGGTVALTSDEIVVTGGTARSNFDNIGWTMATGLGEDGFGVNLGDRTRQTIDEGNRIVTCKFDPRWIGDDEFFTPWLAGEPAVVELFFEGVLMGATDPGVDGTNKFTIKITMPYVQYDDAATPDISQQYGLRRTTVNGSAKVDPTIGVDVGITVLTTDDLATLLT